MICAIASGGTKSMVRVAVDDDRAGIQQTLGMEPPAHVADVAALSNSGRPRPTLY